MYSIFNQLSSSLGLVIVSNQCVSNEWAKGVFSDVENLTEEERIDEVLKEFIKDFEEGSLERNGWPKYAAAYTVAKASMNAYTRIIAKKYPSLCINCVSPVCSRFSGINPLISFEPSIFELSIFIRGKGKNE